MPNSTTEQLLEELESILQVDNNTEVRVSKPDGSSYITTSYQLAIDTLVALIQREVTEERLQHCACVFGHKKGEQGDTVCVESCKYHSDTLQRENRAFAVSVLEKLRMKVYEDEDNCAKFAMPEEDVRIYRKLVNALVERANQAIAALKGVSSMKRLHPVYKTVKVQAEHCPQCGEQLRGNSSMYNPWRCKCGIWKSSWSESGYEVGPNPVSGGEDV